jgi:type III restriction enzyme
MALHPDFPTSPHVVLDPKVRWFPADEALRESTMDKLIPPLVPQLRKLVRKWRESGYKGATDTSRSLLNWWFESPHLLAQYNGPQVEFQYFFAQRESIETIVYLVDVVGIRDKFDLMRFDSSGAVSASMFDETWRRLVVKMATGAGKTKVLSLALAWSFYHKTYEETSMFRRPHVPFSDGCRRVCQRPPRQRQTRGFRQPLRSLLAPRPLSKQFLARLHQRHIASGDTAFERV